VRTFGRLYRFEFLPLGFFSRVAVGVREERRTRGKEREREESR